MGLSFSALVCSHLLGWLFFSPCLLIILAGMNTFPFPLSCRLGDCGDSVLNDDLDFTYVEYL